MTHLLPTLLRSAAFRIALLASLAAVVPGQPPLHSRTQLIEGQPGWVSLQASPGAIGWFAFGFQGPGNGLCLGVPGPCLDFAGAPLVLPLGVVPASGRVEVPFRLPAQTAGLPVSSQAVIHGPQGAGFQVSNAIHGPILTLAALDDEFDGPVLSADWQNLHPVLTEVSQVAGAMRLVPRRGGPANSWYADGEGPFLYKTVAGDFTVAARIRTGRHSDPTRPPILDFNLAGLCVRDPDAPPGDHDWVHLTVGAGNAQVPLAVEDKNTVDSVSNLVLYPIPSHEVEIQIRRRGPMIHCAWRAVGAAPWTALRSFHRGDFPEVLQVGIDIGWWRPTQPDLRAEVDWVRFSR